MIKLITVSQPHVITKKDVNSDSNGLSSTRVNNIAKTRRPQPRSNIKNDRVPTASKSSCSKNKEVERENTLGTYYIPKNRNICHLNLTAQDVDSCITSNPRGNLQFKRFFPNFPTLFLAVFRNRSALEIIKFARNFWFCDSDLEVAFIRNTCFVRNLEGVDLLKGNRTTNLYTINLHEMASGSPIFLMAHATSTNPMRVENINGKRYVLVIVDDYSRYTWEHFLRSKDEAPEEIKTFLKKITVLLQALVIIPSFATRTALAAQVPQVLQTPTASTTTADTVPTPTNSSSQAIHILNTSQDVDELETQQQHVQQQENQAPLQSEIVADNVLNAMLDGDTFVNLFAPPSTSAAESSSSQYVDPSNMHTLYQPYPRNNLWTKDHPLEQVIGEPHMTRT
ncbi:integrase, catalytic region, zinc finger, CCHC-type containing protein [Tanacetum coccineum]|uniref:Integrase, catalytic region, zinc finger, CCHC-type containing protein n=1 Tax=Tanacetum coccineum TaxID=301880 RepID=A0ABQ5FMC2_9ASTR